MKFIIFATIILLHLVSVLPAQAVWQCTDSIGIAARYATTDKLQQTYCISSDNRLLLYNNTRNITFQYSNNQLGTLTMLDVTNPLNIQLWYPDFKTVVWLDRSLAPISKLSFLQTNVGDATCVAMAANSQVWVFDAADYTLLKTNKQGDILQRSLPWNQLFDVPTGPSIMQEQDNILYAYIPDYGLVLFDQFGQWIRRIALDNITHFQVFQHYIVYRKENILYLLDINTQLDEQLTLPTMANDKAIYLDEQGLLVCNDEQVFYWKYIK